MSYQDKVRETLHHFLINWIEVRWIKKLEGWGMGETNTWNYIEGGRKRRWRQRWNNDRKNYEVREKVGGRKEWNKGINGGTEKNTEGGRRESESRYLSVVGRLRKRLTPLRSGRCSRGGTQWGGPSWGISSTRGHDLLLWRFNSPVLTWFSLPPLSPEPPRQPCAPKLNAYSVNTVQYKYAFYMQICISLSVDLVL